MNDDQLHVAFTELRRVESATAPPYEQVSGAAAIGEGRRGRRPHMRRPYMRLAFAAVLLIAIALVMIPRRPPAPSITTWKAPTDFLLQTPGRELLQSVPDLKGTRQ